VLNLHRWKLLDYVSWPTSAYCHWTFRGHLGSRMVWRGLCHMWVMVWEATPR
jgi:hypothetical protein